MAKLQRNFIKGKMNKSLDERLVPNGEYIDALNVRIGSTELSEIGSVENSKGNTRLTFIEYDNQPLSDNAKCIGAYEDGAEETIYWFITDPSHTGGQATGKLDLIVSYDVNQSSLTYHVISVDDGGGVDTTLNFDPQYLITGVNKVDNLLFFTDNLNQPRVIDVEKNYPDPSPAYVDGGGSPLIFAESLLVVKKPPLNSPTFELTNIGSEQNFLVDRFICFAYRYRYENDQYSATSQFTNVAFVAKPFQYEGDSYLNEGMENFYDTAIITFNSGSELVVGIDLLFKEAGNPVIRVIEKLNKKELGYSDNQDYTYQFSNNKIYTVLNDDEILRLYDNVPLKAQAQTVMGSRLVYGNYVDGFDLIDSNGQDTKIDYEVEYLTEEIGLRPVISTTSDGVYNIDGAVTQLDSEIDIDLTGVDLVANGILYITITFDHGSFTSEPPSGLSQIGSTEVNFAYFLNQDFATVQDLQFSQNFGDKVGRSTTIQPIADACDGFTFTDLVNCLTPQNKVDGNGIVWAKTGSGINNPGEGMSVLGGATNHIRIKLPATVYSDGVSNAYEYYSITGTEVVYQSISETSSLHSNRDYEVGIVYMDEFNRSTSVLVSQRNIVHIPCENSITKNKLRVEIPTDQIPPAFATRYKFAIKQDREIYENIYSTFYFTDFNSDVVYVRLDGENAQKVQEGDILRIKANSLGPQLRCEETIVLEKKAQEEDFINVTYPNGEVLFVPSGVYAKFKSAYLTIDNTQRLYIDLGLKRETAVDTGLYTDGITDYPILAYPINFTGDEASPVYIQDEKLETGYIVKFKFEIRRDAENGFFGTPKRQYFFEKEYVVSQTYNTFKDWWEGDSIYETLADGTESLGFFGFGGGLGAPQAPPFINPNPPKYLFMKYDSSLAASKTDLPANVGSDANSNFFRFYEDGLKKFLLIKSSSEAAALSPSYVEARIEIIRGGNVLIFETEPQDAAPDIWYESPVSYPITGGFHEGNVQNQTAILPAIIDTAFENCFTFGNGAESYKIRDSITRSTFGLGNRTNSVLKGEEYKQVHRFADLTYSGTYNYNLNNLNEFNLGLLNFKPLEPSFGFVRKLFARSTDILVLQEDKISYVLAGKNLLSDSAAGGAITSVPEVLGTQIARIEEYGISHNPESFAQYGYDKYFTDSKRGVLLQLKGSSYNNDQLVVISNFGMSSWFRNLFLEDGDTQKLGGYDPYMKEYVLSSNNTLVPVVIEPIACGVRRTFNVSASNPINFTVDLGQYVGDCSVAYNVITTSAAITIETNYNGVVQTDLLPPLAVPGTGTPIDKNLVDVQTADVSITMLGGEATIELSIGCPDADEVTIIQVCLSNSADSTKTIRNEYKWTSGTFTSPLHSQLISLASGTSSPLVSQYSSVNGFEGGGVIPIDGATVSIISRKLQSDTFDYDTTYNRLGYLRTNTLYNNNSADIISLLGAATLFPAPPSGGVGRYFETFTMPTSTDQYLYLIYDYRVPTTVTLCHSNTSADDACCGC